VGDGVEEGVLPLVAADFADQEDGVRTTPVVIRPKRMRPTTSRAMRRSLRMIQAMLKATRPPTMNTPRVMARAMAPRRRVMFMAWR